MLKLIAFLSLAFLLGPVCPSHAARPTKHNVLVLHSYYKGFSWSESEDKGIHQVLNDSSPRVEIYVEHMDSKRFASPDLFKNLYRLYRDKYHATRFKVIISCDDNALAFLLQYRHKLFAGVPIVFCGVNNLHTESLGGHEGITGIVERINIVKTIEAMIALDPGLDQVVIVVDNTITGQGTQRTLRKALASFAGRMRFRVLSQLSMAQILGEVSRLPMHSAVLMMNFNRDVKGAAFTHEEALALIRRKSTVPIYGLWDFHLGGGIVGGVITSGRRQGAIAAAIAMRILKGESARHIPIVNERPHDLVFDYKQLQPWGFSLKQLPPNSRLINGPVGFYEINKKIIWGLAGLIVFLMLVTLVLAINVVQRRRAQRALGKVNRALVCLSTSNQAMLEAESENGLLREICRIIVETSGYPLAWVAYPQGAGQTSLRIKARWSSRQEGPGRAQVPDDECRELESAARRAVAEDLPVVSRELSTGPAYGLALPLSMEGRAMGVLSIRSDEMNAFDDQELALLVRLAKNLAYGLWTLRLTAENERARQQLRTSNEKLSMLLESLPLVPFATEGADPRRLTYVSRAIKKITGYPPQVFLDDSSFWLGHIHPEDRDQTIANLGRLEVEGRLSLKYRFRAENGSYLWLRDIRQLIKDDGGSVRVTGTWQDFSREETLHQEAETRLQQLIQADKLASLGEVVAGVAHEINNPNSFIAYNLPMLEDTWSAMEPMIEEHALRRPEWRVQGMGPDEIRQEMAGIIGAIKHGSERINNVVNQLKEYVRRSPMDQLNDLDLSIVTKSALSLLNTTIRKSFARFDLDLAASLPPVSGSVTRLEQVITNLVINACQASSSRQSSVLKITTRHLPGRQAVIILVEDNCHGISPELIGQIFEPLFSTRSEDGGTGLGLSIALRLVQEHQGSLTLVSRPGTGSRFTVFLPVQGNGPLVLKPALLWVGLDPDSKEVVKRAASSVRNGPSLLLADNLESMTALLDQYPEIRWVALYMSAMGETANDIYQYLTSSHPLVRVVFYARQAPPPGDLPNDAMILGGPLEQVFGDQVFAVEVKAIL